jgi:Flp pilus assembly protein protease CpaA
VNLLLQYFPLVALLGVAVVIDWRQRRIPNWLNGLTFVCGVIYVSMGWLPISGWGCLLGVLVGFGMVFPRVLLGATGAGDLKQHMAIGAWVGPIGILVIALGSTVIGGGMAIAQAAYSGKLSMLARNSAVLAVNLVHARTVGADHIEQTGKGFRSIDRPLPYAVPVFVATVGLLTVWSLV